MAPLGFFRRKKKVEEKKEVKEETKPSKKTLLEELCGGDAELYEALSGTLLLNPTQVLKEGIKSYAEKAADFESKGDHLKARIQYQVAGEIALYERNPEQVLTFFKKCTQLESSPRLKKIFEFFTKKKNVDKAVKVAQEYYARALKPTETRE